MANAVEMIMTCGKRQDCLSDVMVIETATLANPRPNEAEDSREMIAPSDRGMLDAG